MRKGLLTSCTSGTATTPESDAGRTTVRQPVATHGAGLGLVAVAAVPGASALAQTVQVGAGTVTVPSSGQIVVAGRTVPVRLGGKRVVVVKPPAGSTPFQVGGQTEYRLPAGAAGESSTYSSAASYGDSVTVSSTAVYGSTSTTPGKASTNSPAASAASGPRCEITAYTPSSPAGSATMRGTSYLGCSGPSAGSVSVQVQSSLYWESIDGGGWKDQGYAKSPWSHDGSNNVTFIHTCSQYTVGYWHTRGDGWTVWAGVEASYLDNSNGPLIECKLGRFRADGRSDRTENRERP